MAVAPFFLPGGFDTFIPQAQASLQADISQNENSFKLNRYVTVAKVGVPDGYWRLSNPFDESRLGPPGETTPSLANAEWADGTYPQINFVQGSQWLEYRCRRYNTMFSIGDIAAQSSLASGWNALADSALHATNNQMVKRTFNVLTAINTVATWNSNTGAASGNWSTSTSSTLHIQKDIQAGIIAIQKSTSSAIGPDELVGVLSPDVAVGISQSGEIRDFLAQSYVAKEFLKGDGFLWNIPSPLYGVRLVVEDRVYNSQPVNTYGNANYIMGSNFALLARPGALMGALNTMSTVTLAMYQDLGITTEYKKNAQLTEVNIFDMYATLINFPTGYLIQSVLS